MKKNYSKDCTGAINIAHLFGMGRTFITLILLLLMTQLATAQSIKVMGTVKATDGSTLPGVNIKIKGQTAGTVTNVDGKYNIEAPSASTVLIFSFIGYSTQEVTVGDQKVIDVVLTAQANSLNEVVVIGYGSVKKKDLTGSVSSINMEDALKAPVGSIDNALAGRVAGLVVSGNDGQPGEPDNFVIRGAGSVTQDTSPLYVIDGFPLEASDFNSLSPQDIASIEVLKDASATAIYGSRGANGVIIVTTKRGTTGAPVISFNTYYGIQNDPKTIPLMDSYNYINYALALSPAVDSTQAGSAQNRYLFAGYPANVPRRTVDYYKNFPTTNLGDDYIKNAPMQNYDLSIRGGNANTQYSVSGNVFDQTGILAATGFKRTTGRFSLDQKFNDAVKVGVNANYAYTLSYGGIVGGTQDAVSLSSLYGIYAFNPTVGPQSNEAFDPSTDLITDPTVTSGQVFNPLVNAENTLNNTYTHNLIANAYLQIALTRDITFKATGGIVSDGLENDAFYNSLTNKGNPIYTSKGANGSINTTYLNTWLNENTLTYNHVFNSVHTVNFVAGFSQTASATKNYGLTAQNLPNESEGLDGLDEAPSGGSSVTSSSSSRNSLASFYGRANYNYKEKYLLTGTIRADGSSKFSPSNRWGYFPSGAFAWRISNEDFMKSVTVINDLKFRASYGETGNNRVGDFSYLPQFSFPTTIGYSYNNAPVQGAAVSNFGNPDLKWETVTQTDLGLDMGMFNSRLQLTVDVYNKVTKNLILNANLPYTTGLSSAYINVGSIANRGLEITLNGIVIQSKNFSWNSNFNISFNANKVLGLSNGATELLTNIAFDQKYDADPAYIAKVGQPVTQFYGFLFTGIYQYSDFDKLPNGTYKLKPNITDNGIGRGLQTPGQPKYADLNNDGVINTSDETTIGNALPLYTGGFSNNFSFHNFDLNVFFQYSVGNDIENATRYIFQGNGRGAGAINQFASYEDYWTPTNPSNTLSAPNAPGPPVYSSRVIESGSYLRLKTVSLGYNVPKDLLSRFKISSLRVYMSGQNLITWTPYTGPDPEVSSRNSTLTQGFDYAAYPHSRVITFGLNVSL